MNIFGELLEKFFDRLSFRIQIFDNNLSDSECK